MNIYEMTKEEFDNLPYLDIYDGALFVNGKLPFRSLVIVPTGEMYDETEYGCMAFVLADDKGEVIGKIGGGSDVVHIDGIGGYGDNLEALGKLVPAKGWCIDCLKSGYLNLWTKKKLFITDRIICSSFEVYSETER